MDRLATQLRDCRYRGHTWRNAREFGGNRATSSIMASPATGSFGRDSPDIAVGHGQWHATIASGMALRNQPRWSALAARPTNSGPRQNSSHPNGATMSGCDTAPNTSSLRTRTRRHCPTQPAVPQIACANIIRCPSGVATAISRHPQGLSAGAETMIAPRAAISACSASTSPVAKNPK